MAIITLDKERTLRFDYNSIADIEEKTGNGIGVLLSEQRVGLHTLRLLYSGGLKHEDKDMSVVKAGKLLNDYLQSGGSWKELGDKLSQALDESGIMGNVQAAD